MNAGQRRRYRREIDRLLPAGTCIGRVGDRNAWVVVRRDGWGGLFWDSVIAQQVEKPFFQEAISIRAIRPAPRKLCEEAFFVASTKAPQASAGDTAP